MLYQPVPPFVNSLNYAFIGESGCGKSELAINLAYRLHSCGKEVHLFDLDQTKPLFRSRDLKERLLQDGMRFHYEEQYYDTPTIAGGITWELAAANSCCILDLGGNDTGSRVIGGFSPLINAPDTTVYFVINPFRPWSRNFDAVAGTLQSILNASRVAAVRVICNPSLGYATTAEEARDGVFRTEAMLTGHFSIDFVTVRSEIAAETAEWLPYQVYPMQLYFQYPWTQN